MVLIARAVAIAIVLVVSAPAGAQVISGDMAMEEYLSLLDRLMPAARKGAEVYREAFASRCGRPLKTLELRKAMAEGEGDPILMGMIRAAHYQDRTSLDSLAAKVRCRGEKTAP